MDVLVSAIFGPAVSGGAMRRSPNTASKYVSGGKAYETRRSRHRDRSVLARRHRSSGLRTTGTAGRKTGEAGKASQAGQTGQARTTAAAAGTWPGAEPARATTRAQPTTAA